MGYMKRIATRRMFGPALVGQDAESVAMRQTIRDTLQNVQFEYGVSAPQVLLGGGASDFDDPQQPLDSSWTIE
jgi:hypothetical protein